MAGKRGSFARMNGQITELSRDSLEEMGKLFDSKGYLILYVLGV